MIGYYKGLKIIVAGGLMQASMHVPIDSVYINGNTSRNLNSIEP